MLNKIIITSKSKYFVLISCILLNMTSCTKIEPNAYLIKQSIIYSNSMKPKHKMAFRKGVQVDFSKNTILKNDIPLVNINYEWLQNGWIPINALTTNFKALSFINIDYIEKKNKVIFKDASNVFDCFTKKKIHGTTEAFEFYAYKKLIYKKKPCYLIGKYPSVNKFFFQKSDFLGWVYEKDLIFWNTEIAGFDKYNRLYLKVLNNRKTLWYKSKNPVIWKLDNKLDYRDNWQPSTCFKNKYNARGLKWNNTKIKYWYRLIEKYRAYRNDIENTITLLNDLIDFLANKEYLKYKKLNHIFMTKFDPDKPIRFCLNKPLLLPIKISILDVSLSELKNNNLQSYSCEIKLLRDKLRCITSGNKFIIIESMDFNTCQFSVEKIASMPYFDKDGYIWMNQQWLNGKY